MQGEGGEGTLPRPLRGHGLGDCSDSSRFASWPPLSLQTGLKQGLGSAHGQYCSDVWKPMAGTAGLGLAAWAPTF